MSSLATIAQDCIANVIHYLGDNDFVSLMETGNMLLRHKLRLTCIDLSLESLPLTKFPFTAFNLPKLRSLSVLGIIEAPVFLDFRNEGDKTHSKGCKTLEKLELGFRNAPGLFLTPGSTIPRLTIRDRFPSLTTLILSDFRCEASLEGLFGELPENLTTLALAYLDARPESEICLSSIANLPRSLTYLTITDCLILNPKQSDSFKFESVLPPNLVHLELKRLSEPDVLNYLPSSLRYLRFYLQNAPERVHWKIEKAPKMLKKVVSDLGLLHSILPLPRFHLPFECGTRVDPRNPRLEIIYNTPERVEILPNSLFTLALISDAVQRSHSIFSKFPYLERTVLKGLLDVSLLPRGLKSLKIDCVRKIGHPLPDGLESLQVLKVPLIPSDINHIPATLQSLDFGFVDGRTLKTQHSDYPPWGEAELSQLASIANLTSFRIDFHFISCVSALAPVKTMKKLNLFALANLGPDDLVNSPDWLPKCLPTQLSELFLDYNPNSRQPENDLRNDIPDDFLRLCKLDEVVPHLRKFTLKINLLRTILWTSSSFASLPRGLVNFKLDCHFANSEPQTLSMLPRSLKSLTFQLWEHVRSHRTAQHFAGLPELSYLHFSLARRDEVDVEVFDLFPKSIVQFHIFSIHDDLTRRLGSEKIKFVRKNPLCQGFVPHHTHWIEPLL